jgi:hypothetical protein
MEWNLEILNGQMIGNGHVENLEYLYLSHMGHLTRQLHKKWQILK